MVKQNFIEETKEIIGMRLAKSIQRSLKRKATNAAKQTMYYAMYGQEMPAKKRIVKSVIK